MNLRPAPSTYSSQVQNETNRQISSEMSQKHDRRTDITLQPKTGIVMLSPSGARFRLTVDDAGNLVTTSL